MSRCSCADTWKTKTLIICVFKNRQLESICTSDKTSLSPLIRLQATFLRQIFAVQHLIPEEPPSGAFYTHFPHTLSGDAKQMDEDALAEQASAVLQAQQDELDESMEQDLDNDPFTSRRGHAHKRAEEPPRNADGKYICRFQDKCPEYTFERKCEWSKHMDKHERPYKCEELGCEKLLGFTYSGGLLRHQREVHKMHGGTKEPLYCPFPNCKRNQGTGFTRKENRDEHIRRVHRRATDGIEQDPKRNSESMEATDPELVNPLLPSHGLEEIGNENIDPDTIEHVMPNAKRRRIQTNGTPSLDNGNEDLDLKIQIRKLQESNNWCYKLIQRVQEENNRLQERVNRLENDLGAHVINSA